MARYDSPDFPDQLPGFGPRNSHDYGSAAGSDAQWKPQPPPPAGQSGMPGVGTVAPLTQTDGGETGVSTEQPNQTLTMGPAGREPFTGMPDMGSTGAGHGHAAGPGNPNAA